MCACPHALLMNVREPSTRFAGGRYFLLYFVLITWCTNKVFEDRFLTSCVCVLQVDQIKILTGGYESVC